MCHSIYITTSTTYTTIATINTEPLFAFVGETDAMPDNISKSFRKICYAIIMPQVWTTRVGLAVKIFRLFVNCLYFGKMIKFALEPGVKNNFQFIYMCCGSMVGLTKQSIVPMFEENMNHKILTLCVHWFWFTLALHVAKL